MVSSSQCFFSSPFHPRDQHPSPPDQLFCVPQAWSSPFFSDHLPVRLSFSGAPPPGKRRPTLPTWLAESPAFAQALRYLWKGKVRGGPFKELARFKKVLFSAALVARRFKVETSSVNLKVSQRVALFKLLPRPFRILGGLMLSWGFVLL